MLNPGFEIGGEADVMLGWVTFTLNYIDVMHFVLVPYRISAPAPLRSAAELRRACFAPRCVCSFDGCAMRSPEPRRAKHGGRYWARTSDLTDVNRAL